MNLFSPRGTRNLLYVALAACLGFEAFTAPYLVNVDTTSYYDLADLIRSHDWHWVVNAYWHPGYPALLAILEGLTGSPVDHELRWARLLNLTITVLLFVAMRFAIDAATGLREHLYPSHDDEVRRLDPVTLEIFAAGVTLIAVLRDITIQKVGPDMLLSVLLVAAMAFMMRVAAGSRGWNYAGVGVCFGLAFLVKSVAFPLFLISVAALVFCGRPRRTALRGAVAAALVFGALAGPYIGALSRQKGRFSAGDSGGLNYAWYVDGADRFEQQKNDPARYHLAKGALKHTSTQVMADPGVYFYGTAMPGTETQWFDPSYWNDGLKPVIQAKAQIAQLKGNLAVVVQYVLLRPQFLLLLAMLWMAGARWRAADFGLRGSGAVVFLMVAQLGMYLLVLTEPRYISASMLMTIILLLVFLELPPSGPSPSIQPRTLLAPAAVMFLGMTLSYSLVNSVQNLKKNRESEGVSQGAYKRSIFTAGASLAAAPGIHPGSTVACLGEEACRDDDYWARLARVQIRTEVFADGYGSGPNSALAVWQRADKDKVKAALRSTGAQAMVARFGTDVDTPAGWQRLGTGDFFVLYL